MPWQCYSSCRAGGRQVDSISLLPVAYWQAACHSPEGGVCAWTVRMSRGHSLQEHNLMTVMRSPCHCDAGVMITPALTLHLYSM